MVLLVFRVNVSTFAYGTITLYGPCFPASVKLSRLVPMEYRTTFVTPLGETFGLRCSLFARRY
jgi:hypothetical protein